MFGNYLYRYETIFVIISFADFYIITDGKHFEIDDISLHIFDESVKLK